MLGMERFGGALGHARSAADPLQSLLAAHAPSSPPFASCMALCLLCSIADVLLLDIVDLHTRIYGEEFRAAWPALAALHDK